MSNEINLNTRDLRIKILDDGREVVQLAGSTAFDKSFIEECREKGVQIFEIEQE